MADKKTPKTAGTAKHDSGESKSAKKDAKVEKTEKVEVASQGKRRTLRAAEPTTLREQSEKAQAKSALPQKKRPTSLLVMPFRALGRFLASVFRPLGRFRIIRIIGYILAPPYIRNSWKELKQVTWPNRTQTRRLTFAVILFSLVFGAIVAGVDYGFDKLFRALITNQ